MTAKMSALSAYRAGKLGRPLYGATVGKHPAHKTAKTQHIALILYVNSTCWGKSSTTEVQGCMVGVSVIWCLLHVPVSAVREG
jgi:hypothetical protein